MLDGIALRLFGMTRDDARQKLVCVKCKKGLEELAFADWPEADRLEYRISSLCPSCFHRATDEPEDAA